MTSFHRMPATSDLKATDHFSIWRPTIRINFRLFLGLRSKADPTTLRKADVAHDRTGADPPASLHHAAREREFEELGQPPSHQPAGCRPHLIDRKLKLLLNPVGVEVLLASVGITTYIRQKPEFVVSEGQSWHRASRCNARQ